MNTTQIIISIALIAISGIAYYDIKRHAQKAYDAYARNSVAVQAAITIAKNEYINAIKAGRTRKQAKSIARAVIHQRYDMMPVEFQRILINEVCN